MSPTTEQHLLNDQRHRRAWWRVVVAYFLIVLGAIVLIGYLLASYVNTTMLNTDNYLTIVSGFPKNPAIATGVSTYAVNQLFTAVDVPARVKEVLPDRAGFLADPISDQLHTRGNRLALKIVQSDQFSAVWIGANQLIHSKLIALAHTPPATGQSKVAQAALGLGNLVNQVRDRLGLPPASNASQIGSRAGDLAVNLRLRVNQLRYTVKVVEKSVRILPILLLALWFGALAVAPNRRRAWLGIGVFLLLVGISYQITLRWLAQNIASSITDGTYRAAVTAVVQAFSHNLHTEITWVYVASAVVLVSGLVAGPYAWAVALRHWLRFDRFSRTGLYHYGQVARAWVAHHLLWLYGGGVAVILILLLLVPQYTVGTLVGLVALFGWYAALLTLLAYPAWSKVGRPMVAKKG